MSDSNLKTINYFNYNEWLTNDLVYRLFQQFFDKGKYFFKRNFTGLVEDFEVFCQELETLADVKKVFDISEDDDDTTRIYLFEHHFFSVYAPVTNKITVEVITDDEEFLKKVSTFFDLKFKEIKKEKQIHMIAPDEFSEQTTLYPIGDVATPLTRLNYNDDVLKKFDFVVKELNAEVPTGRMVLVDGPPGSGKSFLIRALLNEINYATCVLVPVSMLESLDKPTLVPLLLKQRQNKHSRNRFVEEKSDTNGKHKPIILIIEDADSVLVPRQADNMSAISSLLNYTDGIFGSLFDLRIIATTNAHHVEIESALLRPGRLLKRIHVDLLKPSRAEEVFESLTKQKKTFEKETSLATIYCLANGNEPEETQKEENIVGF